MALNNREKVYRALATVLDIDINLINDATGPDNVESWDSFSALMLIAELEEVFGLKFTMEEVEYIKSVGSIIDVLKRKNVQFQ